MTGCNKSNRLLADKDFENGDWLLVNVNYAEKTLKIIDDEQVLLNNKNGLWVTPFAECGGTTCDGFKDGKLIAEDEYLTKAVLYESSAIKSSYEKGNEWTIDPIDKIDFDRKWDSLLKVNCYPTIYHTQPADKDIIWVYKIEKKTNR